MPEPLTISVSWEFLARVKAALSDGRENARMLAGMHNGDGKVERIMNDAFSREASMCGDILDDFPDDPFAE